MDGQPSGAPRLDRSLAFRGPRHKSWQVPALAAAVGLTTWLAFLPALGNGFVDWDDPHTLLNNRDFRGLGGPQLRWMFTTFFWGHYQPLFWLSYAVDYTWCRAWFGEGLTARGYHLTSTILHAINASLVFLLAVRVLRARAGTAVYAAQVDAGALRSVPLLIGSVVAALAWSVHPLRVEPVAWATGRGDLLATLFLLIALLSYLRAVGTGGRRAAGAWLVTAVLSYALSLLSRAMGVTFPLVLLVLDWCPLGRLGGGRGRWFGSAVHGVWLEKVPFVLLAAGAAWVAPLAKAQAGSTIEVQWHGLGARVVQACYGFVFYIWKTLVPAGLSPTYELRFPINVWAPRYVLSIVALAVAVVAAFLVRRRLPGVAAAGLGYALLLLPVLGFVQAGNQAAADRYGYLPTIGLAMLSAAVVDACGRGVAALRIGCLSLCTLAVAGLSVLTGRQCGIWHSPATLWTYAAAVSPDSSIAQNGYGWVLVERQQFAEAADQFRRALELQPTNEHAHNNLWRALREQGRTDELFAVLRETVVRHPGFADAHWRLGLELHNRGEFDPALDEYRALLRLEPTHARALTNLGQLYERRGELSAAQECFEKAVASDSRNLNARRGLARVLKAAQRDADALAQLRQALLLDPNDVRSRQLWEQWTGDAPPGPAAPAPLP